MMKVFKLVCNTCHETSIQTYHSRIPSSIKEFVHYSHCSCHKSGDWQYDKTLYIVNENEVIKAELDYTNALDKIYNNSNEVYIL